MKASEYHAIGTYTRDGKWHTAVSEHQDAEELDVAGTGIDAESIYL